MQIYDSWVAAGMKLKTKTQQDRFFGSVVRYLDSGAEPSGLSDTAATVFIAIRPSLDSQRDKKRAGAAGAKSRWAGRVEDCGEIANDGSAIHETTMAENGSDIPETAMADGGSAIAENGMAKVREGKVRKEEPPDGGSKKAPQSERFRPPTVQEVAGYAREKGIAVDAERFCDFYASKGWRVGSSPMRDWKAAARNWAARDRSEAKGAISRAADFSEYDRGATG